MSDGGGRRVVNDELRVPLYIYLVGAVALGFFLILMIFSMARWSVERMDSREDGEVVTESALLAPPEADLEAAALLDQQSKAVPDDLRMRLLRLEAEAEMLRMALLRLEAERLRMEAEE